MAQPGGLSMRYTGTLRQVKSDVLDSNAIAISSLNIPTFGVIRFLTCECG